MRGQTEGNQGMEIIFLILGMILHVELGLRRKLTAQRGWGHRRMAPRPFRRHVMPGAYLFQMRTQVRT